MNQSGKLYNADCMEAMKQMEEDIIKKKKFRDEK